MCLHLSVCLSVSGLFAKKNNSSFVIFIMNKPIGSFSPGQGGEGMMWGSFNAQVLFPSSSSLLIRKNI